MRERVTVVLPVLNQLALTRACVDSLRASTEPFRLLVIDSGSTDGTAEFFAGLSARLPLSYERAPRGIPLSQALNRAWRLAESDVICFLHNDTEMIEPAWLSRLVGALGAPGVGLAGLYGIKRVRRNGRYVGRTIVHSLADGPTVSPPWEEVAVVDAVCMALPRRLLEDIGGVDEGFPFHGIDRDLSFAVRERDRRVVVVHAPFRHHGGGTRTREFGSDPERERADLAERDASLARFAGKWSHRLPCDVRPLGQRVADWMRGDSRRGGGPVAPREGASR